MKMNYDKVLLILYRCQSECSEESLGNRTGTHIRFFAEFTPNLIPGSE